MKRILFLNRYDEQSPSIFKYALKIAELLDAIVLLAHVYKGASIPMIGDGIKEFQVREEISKSLERNNRQRELEKLTEFVDEHRPDKYSNILLEYHVANGIPKYEILELIKNQKVDLITMGMKSPNKFWEAIHGDLAPKMIDLANCPILLVPPNAKSFGLKKIAYAVDLVNPDLISIKILFDWVIIFKGELHLVHKKDELLKMNDTSDKMKQLIHNISGPLPPSNIHYHILNGNTSESIIDFLEKTQANIIGMTTEHRGFWKQLFDPSLTKEIAQKAGIPVLVFKKKQ